LAGEVQAGFAEVVVRPARRGSTPPLAKTRASRRVHPGGLARQT